MDDKIQESKAQVEQVLRITKEIHVLDDQPAQPSINEESQ